jgi:Bax protein
MYPLASSLGFIILSIAAIAWAKTPTVPDFSQYPEGEVRKVAFLSYFRPLIKRRNQTIRNNRHHLETWYKQRPHLGLWALSQIKDLASEYRMTEFDVDNEKHWRTLLRRVDIVPASLALAQAAKESAWGTSRFAREVHNYFGQWCFKKGCGVVPNDRKPGAYHEVADFDSPQDAVVSYFNNLNSYYAYKPLRKIRARLRAEDKPITGLALVKGLAFYSERRADYIQELRSFISQNDLLQYDLAQAEVD